MSEEDAEQFALDRFVEAGDRTQQSPALSQLTHTQTGGAALRSVTSFKQSLNQYFQQYMSAWRNLVAGRMTKQEFGRAMLLHHLLLPNLFMLANTLVKLLPGGQEDEEDILADHIIATLLGPIAGSYASGDLAVEAMQRFANAAFGVQVDFFDWKDIIPFLDAGDGITRGAGKLGKGEFVDTASTFAENSIGPLTGTPIKRILDATEGVSDILGGDFADGFLILLGWTPRIVEGKPKKAKKKKAKAPIGF